jgi:hypothetical protein
MTQRHLARTTLATVGGLLAAGLAFGAQAQFEPQGLYSAQTILDADVHFEAAPDSQASSVVDLLLGDDMQVHALVVRPDASVELEGDDLVITNAHYRLVTHEGEDGEITHDVVVDATEESLEAMPRYDSDWWNQARERAREAWHAAGEGADSAWHRTREGADRVGEGAERAWERAQEGAERAREAIGEALDDTND